MEWEPVIGLEIHVQLATKSKIFSGSPTAYGAAANEQASAIDLALPGTLPTVNEKVLEMAIRFGCAINADIALRSIFARKNYFYPDLPKGYQITYRKQGQALIRTKRRRKRGIDYPSAPRRRCRKVCAWANREKNSY